MDPTSTRVPDVVAALVSLAASTLPDVTVFDGPKASQQDPVNVLMVGVGNEEDLDPYRTSRDEFRMGAQCKEEGTVRCQLTTWTGGTDLAALRVTVGGWLADLESALRVDQQLNQTCDLIRLGSMRWYHVQREQGGGVGVNFDVNYTAWI